MVETTLNYLADMPERPAYYFYPPPAGVPWRNTKGDRRRVAIDDARQLAPAPSLDREGFALARLETAATDLFDPAVVQAVYYREVERLVRDTTGASRVAFDYNLRRGSLTGRGEDGVQGPVRFAHNDYTEGSGPQRVRDLLGDEAERLLGGRVAVINVWKPIRGPVQEAPLAVCDARSIQPTDLVPTDLNYPGRTGEVYSLRFNPEHRWYYFSRMRADEGCCSSASTPIARAPASPPTPPSTIPPRRPTRRRARASRSAPWRSFPPDRRSPEVPGPRRFVAFVAPRRWSAAARSSCVMHRSRAGLDATLHPPRRRQRGALRSAPDNA
jgi:hypothetical protein